MTNRKQGTFVLMKLRSPEHSTPSSTEQFTAVVCTSSYNSPPNCTRNLLTHSPRYQCKTWIPDMDLPHLSHWSFLRSHTYRSVQAWKVTQKTDEIQSRIHLRLFYNLQQTAQNARAIWAVILTNVEIPTCPATVQRNVLAEAACQKTAQGDHGQRHI